MRRTSAVGTPVSPASFAMPIGMSSMKRTSIGRSFARAASETSSASLTPLSGTQLSFVFSPAASAASMPWRTAGSSEAERRVMSEKASSASVSRLMFTPSSPAARSSSARSARRTPFVVRATRSMPSTALISRTRSTMPRRRSGSPPVRRTLRMPSCARARTTRTISSKDRISSWESFSTPSAGIQ